MEQCPIKEMEINLKVPIRNDGTLISELVGNLDKRSTLKYKNQTVRTNTLDNILISENHPVSIIKIDVQGNELDVLKGSLNILKKDRPALIIEIEDKFFSNPRKNRDEIAKIFKDLLETNSSSFLLRITSEIINAKNENDQYFIDEVDPVIGQNGTGAWTVKAALDLGVGIPSIYEAVSARSNSKNFKYNFEQNFKENSIIYWRLNTFIYWFFNSFCGNASSFR